MLACLADLSHGHPKTRSKTVCLFSFSTLLIRALASVFCSQSMYPYIVLSMLLSWRTYRRRTAYDQFFFVSRISTAFVCIDVVVTRFGVFLLFCSRLPGDAFDPEDRVLVSFCSVLEHYTFLRISRHRRVISSL
jgi:hypothetical protein